MRAELQSYFRALARKAKLDPSTQDDVVLELGSHVEEKVQELSREGREPEQAMNEALWELGQPDALAEGLYSVHSKGSWRDILLAALPHLLLAILFALHLWTRYIWVVAALVLVTLVAVQAWRRGKPKWTYPWLGYALAAPAMSWLLALISLGYGGWMYFTTGALPYSLPIFMLLVAYVPFSLWLTVNVALRVVRQDWLLVSLTALPFPFLTSWLLFLNWQGGLWALPETLGASDGGRALIFLAMAIITAVFFKLGHRLFKIGLLSISTVVLVVFPLVFQPLNLSLLAAVLIGIASVAFLLSPAVVESRLSRKEGWYNPLDSHREVVTHWFSSAQSQ